MVREVWIDQAEDILKVINTSNREAYKGIIPQEHFREPVVTEEELLADLKRMTFYAWERKGEIVGVAALQLLSEEVGRVRYVYILPQYQRQGIGTDLMTHMEMKAEEIGIRTLRVLTVENANWAVAFYKKLGYRLAEKINKPWGNDVFMEKEL